MNSPGHKGNMENDMYTEFSLVVHSMANPKYGYKDANSNYFIDNLLQTGFGIVGVLTLVENR